MKIVFCILCTIGISFADHPDWFHFKMKYKKLYSNEQEENMRSKIFLENKQKIEKHNQGSPSFILEMNKFGDFTEQEFKARFTGLIESTVQREERFHNFNLDYLIPSEVNWSSKDAVGLVPNQKSCKASWAYATNLIMFPLN